jgi:hypothetical protein
MSLDTLYPPSLYVLPLTSFAKWTKDIGPL